MKTKTKIIISIILAVITTISAFCFGYFKTKNSSGKEIETPQKITYFTNDEKTQSFEITLPKEYLDGKIIISHDEYSKGVEFYEFKQASTGEVLFIVYVSNNDNHKDIKNKTIEIGQSGNITYLWSQSVNKNENIKDKEQEKEYEEIAKYFDAIRKSIVIKGE